MSAVNKHPARWAWDRVVEIHPALVDLPIFPALAHLGQLPGGLICIPATPRVVHDIEVIKGFTGAEQRPEFVLALELGEAVERANRRFWEATHGYRQWRADQADRGGEAVDQAPNDGMLPPPPLPLPEAVAVAEPAFEHPPTPRLQSPVPSEKEADVDDPVSLFDHSSELQSKRDANIQHKTPGGFLSAPKTQDVALQPRTNKAKRKANMIKGTHGARRHQLARLERMLERRNRKSATAMRASPLDEEPIQIEHQDPVPTERPALDGGAAETGGPDEGHRGHMNVEHPVLQTRAAAAVGDSSLDPASKASRGPTPCLGPADRTSAVEAWVADIRLGGQDRGTAELWEASTMCGEQDLSDEESEENARDEEEEGPADRVQSHVPMHNEVGGPRCAFIGFRHPLSLCIAARICAVQNGRCFICGAAGCNRPYSGVASV